MCDACRRDREAKQIKAMDRMIDLAKTLGGNDMKNVTSGPVFPGKGHQYGDKRYNGYAVCGNCGLHENQEGIQYECGSDAARLAVQKSNMDGKLTATVQENNRLRQLLTRVVIDGISGILTDDINSEIGRAK